MTPRGGTRPRQITLATACVYLIVLASDGATHAFLSLPCEGGVRGGGPVSVECTSEGCLARSIDEIDRECAASASCMACRFRTSLWANDEYIDDAKDCGPSLTPPSQGGER